MCYRKFGGNIDSQYTHFSSMFSAGSLALLAHDETDGDRGEQAGDIVTIGRTLCRAVRLSELSLHDFAGSARSGVVPQEFSGSGIPGTARQVETIECQTNYRVPNPDFFVSHSWHDDNAAKFDALEAVAKRFESEAGREPLFW
jgi:hypothetical protein